MEKDFILFNFHSPASPVTLLTACEVVINLGYINLHPSRKAFDDSCQAGTMRFSSGKETEHEKYNLPNSDEVTSRRFPPPSQASSLSFLKEMSYRNEVKTTARPPRPYFCPATTTSLLPPPQADRDTGGLGARALSPRNEL